MDWLSTLPHCALYGRPVLAALHLVGDLATFSAYMAIPIFIEIVRKKRQLPFNFLAALFTAFIALCGLGHLLEAWSTFSGTQVAYWLTGLTKALTGSVSLFTAYYAVKLLPAILDIPTPAQWRELRELLGIYRENERWRQMGKPLPEEEGDSPS